MTAGFLEALPSQYPLFITMDVDKPYWLPIHLLVVMLDHNFTVTQFSRCCQRTIDTTTGVKNVMSGILRTMWSKLCLLLVIVVCISLHLQLPFKYRPNISNTSTCPLVIFISNTKTPNVCIQMQIQIQIRVWNQRWYPVEDFVTGNRMFETAHWLQFDWMLLTKAISL